MFLLIPLSFQTSAIDHAVLFLSYIVKHFVYMVYCSHLQFISRYSKNNSRPTFLQSHIITSSFISLLTFMELQSRWFYHANASPRQWSYSFNYSAKFLSLLLALCYSMDRFTVSSKSTHTQNTHTHNLSSVFYCRSHIAVSCSLYQVPFLQIYFSTNRQPH
jgi:hypothetical protein